MPDEQNEIRSEISDLLDAMRPIALRHPDTPIRQASDVFESLLKRAKRAFPESRAVADMTSGLLGGASHTSLVAKLVALKAATGGGMAVEVPAMKVTREGIFFAGQYFDAYQRITEILDEAESSVVLIDGYVSPKILDLLSGKDASVACTVLTKQVSATPVLRVAVGAFNGQYGGLEVRITEAFHDRFIVIDDKEFYHFGASLKDAGHRGFMFSRIEENAVIGPLRTAIQAEVARAPRFS